MKTKSIGILIQADDDLVYQVALTKDQEQWVLSLLVQMHNGKVKLIEEPIEGVVLI